MGYRRSMRIYVRSFSNCLGIRVEGERMIEKDDRAKYRMDILLAHAGC